MNINSNLKIRNISKYERIFLSNNCPKKRLNTDYILGYGTSHKIYFIGYRKGKKYLNSYLAKGLPSKYNKLYKIPYNYPIDLDLYISEIKIKGKIRHKIINLDNKAKEYNKQLGNVFIEDYLDEFSQYIFTGKYINLYLDNLDYIPKYYFVFIKSHPASYEEVLSLDNIKNSMYIRFEKDIITNLVIPNNSWKLYINSIADKCPICNNLVTKSKTIYGVDCCLNDNCLFPFYRVIKNFDLGLSQQFVIDNNIDNFDKLFSINKNLISKDSYKKIISLKDITIQSFTKKYYIHGSKTKLLEKKNSEILKYYEELVRLKDLVSQDSIVSYYIDSVFNIKLSNDLIRYYLYTLKYIDVLEYFIPKWKIK